EGLSKRFHKIAVRELFKVEEVRRGCGPEAERVDRGTAIPDHRTVERDANQSRWTSRHGAQAASAELERATHADFHLLVRTSDLPRIGRTEPVIRRFLLPSALDRLPEDAVFISQSVPHCR